MTGPGQGATIAGRKGGPSFARAGATVLVRSGSRVNLCAATIRPRAPLALRVARWYISGTTEARWPSSRVARDRRIIGPCYLRGIVSPHGDGVTIDGASSRGFSFSVVPAG